MNFFLSTCPSPSDRHTAGGRDRNPDSHLQPTADSLQSFTAPARRPRKGDAKVRTGVRGGSGCVTGAGGEASKARNAEVCLRAGWRMRRTASHPPASAPLYKRSACGQGGLRFFSRYSGGGYSRKKARPHRPHAVAVLRPHSLTSVPLCLRGETSCFHHPSSFCLHPFLSPLRGLRAFVVIYLVF